MQVQQAISWTPHCSIQEATDVYASTSLRCHREECQAPVNSTVSSIRLTGRSTCGIPRIPCIHWKWSNGYHILWKVQSLMLEYLKKTHKQVLEAFASLGSSVHFEDDMVMKLELYICAISMHLQPMGNAMVLVQQEAICRCEIVTDKPTTFHLKWSWRRSLERKRGLVPNPLVFFSVVLFGPVTCPQGLVIYFAY